MKTRPDAKGHRQPVCPHRQRQLVRRSNRRLNVMSAATSSIQVWSNDKLYKSSERRRLSRVHVLSRQEQHRIKDGMDWEIQH